MEAVSITAFHAYPLIGGEKRGYITQVNQRDEQLFTQTSKFSFNAPGFSREYFSLDLQENMHYGSNLTVLFDGYTLTVE